MTWSHLRDVLVRKSSTGTASPRKESSTLPVIEDQWIMEIFTYYGGDEDTAHEWAEILT